ncbi:MAG: DUF1460 domain-containing protein [Muribaculaceae bacterium]|nr:DUF1460 domain-containing protein [Muribaculaceae bacterium]
MKAFRIISVVLLLMGGLLSQAATTAQMRFHCSGDTTTLDRLLLEGQQSGISQPEALVSFYAHKLLGTPYVAHTLEGDNEMLTINIDQLDCTTFVETLYALARTTLQGRQSWRDYAANLESLRYRGGVMGDYSTRLHYISLWIIDNFSRGNLVEVTPDLPHATTMVKTINFMSAHADSYQSLKGDSAMVVKIKRMEDGLRNHQMPYLKKMWLNKDDVRQALHAGDFVGLVTRIDGLDISHLGIIEKDENGEIYLLDASMSGGKVMIESEPLGRWLKSGKNTLGIRVFRLK